MKRFMPKNASSKNPPEEQPGHHHEHHEPGGDHDHRKDRERLKEDKRVWDERHRKPSDKESR